MDVHKFLEKLEHLAKYATPGPWEDFSDHPDHIAGSVCKGERGIKHICLASFYESTDERQTITHKECLANASFIAAANPETVKMLVRMVEYLAGVLSNSTGIIDGKRFDVSSTTWVEKAYQATEPKE